MLKILVGFILFAALALYVIMKGGDSLDMGGEKHGAEAVHAPAEAPKADAAAPKANADSPRPARYSRYTDSTYVPAYKKKRKYFFIAELRGGPANGGVRITNGYKFGRFGYLGIGVGIDGASFNNIGGPINSGGGSGRS